MHRRKIPPLVLSLSLLFVPLVSSDAGYFLLSDVLSSAGGRAMNDDYLLGVSIGQGIIGLSSNARYIETAGFLYWGTPPGRPEGVRDEWDADLSLPREFDLSQNFPNPFNPATTIDYSLPEVARVRLEIYNVLGQRVRILVDEAQAPGRRSVTWDGRDDYGKGLAAGVYCVRLQAGTYSSSKKLVLLK